MIIAFPTKPSKHGGPGSFQRKFENYVREIGWKVVYPEDNVTPNVIMILGGTKNLLWLIRMKLKRVKIYFRLGGINWLYKVKKVPIARRFYLDFQILLTPLIQKIFADGIIYQSEFSKEWLIKLGQSAKVKNNVIIYNGVDTEEFKPAETNTDEISLLCVEGNIDYSPYAIELLNKLQEKLIEQSDFKSLLLYGSFENPENKNKLNPKIDYRGFIERKGISKIYRNAVYLSLDVNAACPNTVIEALASGIPVIGFDTGALKELVPEEAGEIVPYGGDPWKLDFPDVDALIEAAIKVLNNYEYYSQNARKAAEERFSIKKMTNKYLEVIEKAIKSKQ